ncbi:hypothetical protein AB0C96_39990 [Streptomyces sp. NPDC048506]|uniref:hypothetical protein n=1 Tax=Streptomyces sp. NPDC048506 TaxID=3155028 RepID=UPI003443E3D2
MEPPVIAALIASAVAIATNAGGWAVSIRQTSRQADNEHKQWRRETRRDAYAELLAAMQNVKSVFDHAFRTQDENSDGKFTPEMTAALHTLHEKAAIARFEDPAGMGHFAKRFIAYGQELSENWEILPTIAARGATHLTGGAPWRDETEVKYRADLEEFVATAGKALQDLD